ncbi:hypothetical protein AVEN_71190-1 [Araneus ventricosus]|uniref:Uncharacterized protein n=1 Tax=Araneus ventricosus TaxID=182803 RepID=A0A4Y2W8G7_ARAVE|nr:hypothetical protein AVEN_52671-1 [Araneus ventricosus]GBO32434.1 hypothetical protein AVEN_71190-1 [Araneus ventricosus]
MRQQIYSQRKPPWIGSQHSIQHPGATSKGNFMSPPTNSSRMNETTVDILPKVKTSPTPWQRPEIMLAMKNPFPTYLNRFSLRTTDCCGCGELRSPVQFATNFRLTSSFHLLSPQTT